MSIRQRRKRQLAAMTTMKITKKITNQTRIQEGQVAETIETLPMVLKLKRHQLHLCQMISVNHNKPIFLKRTEL